MKLDAKPTPRPWAVERKREVCSAENDMFTVAYASGATQDEAEANAALIVTAVNEYNAHCAITKAAQALLDRIDNLTTEEFSRGGERLEREALRAALIESPTEEK